MARPIPQTGRVTTYQSRVARQTALREAGGWIGTVELSPEAHAALRALQGDRSISETIEDALIDRRKKARTPRGSAGAG